jgi:hypothetical protein
VATRARWIADVLQQRRLVDIRAGGVRQRLDAGHARAAVQPHLAEIVARAEEAVGDMAAGIAAGEGAQFAGQHDQQRVAAIAFVEHQRPPAKAPDLAALGERAQHFGKRVVVDRTGFSLRHSKGSGTTAGSEKWALASVASVSPV